jgi:FMN-dependent NADH-azoreductase
MASSYLKQVLGFIGVTDVNIVLAVRTLAVDQGEKTLSEFTGQFDSELASAIAI